MEKKKARKNKKKKSVSNIGKEKESLNSGRNNSRTIDGSQKATEEIIEAESKQDDNVIKNETSLLEESDTMHSVLTNNYIDNNDDEKYLATEQRIDEVKLHQEKDSCPRISDCTVSNREDNGNAPQEERDSKETNWNREGNFSGRIQETNMDENNSELSLIEIGDEAKDIKASEIVNSPEIEIKTADFEKNNSSGVHDVSESPSIHNMKGTDRSLLEIHNVGNGDPGILNIETSKSDFLDHQNLNNSDDEIAKRDRNLVNISNKSEEDTVGRILEQMNTANIQDSKAEIEADIEVNNFTISSQDLDTESGILRERIEQLESQEIEARNENIEESLKKRFEAIAADVNLSESGVCITESLISDEAVRSVDDSTVLNEVVEEKLVSADNSIQKPSSPEILKENSGRLDSTKSVTINWQYDSGKEFQTVEDLPGNESKVFCDKELLRDSEESNNDEVAQSKNKFYEAITGFWKHTGFSKKRVGTTMPSEQSRNLFSELNQLPPTSSGKISLAFAESSSEFIKSLEVSSESSTKVTAADSEINVVSSLLENTAIIYPQKTLNEDQTSQNSLNTTVTENQDSDTVSEISEVVIPDSLSVIDESMKDSNDSLEKMGDLKKSKKTKTDSTNLTVFGHKNAKMK